MELGIVISLLFTAFILIVVAYFIGNSQANKRNERIALDKISEAISAKKSELDKLSKAVQVEKNELDELSETTNLEKTDLSKLIETIRSKVEELTNLTEEISLKKSQLFDLDNETAVLQTLKKDENRLSKELSFNKSELNTTQLSLKNLSKEIEEKQLQLLALTSQLDLYSRIDNFVEHGHFEFPEYLYDTSARFAEEIKIVRNSQKELIKDKKAVTYPSSTIITNDKVQNSKLLDGQVKLMLSAFNIECDILISKVSPSNYSRTLERIEKLANSLEKSAAMFYCGFNIEYVEFKYQECQLQYQNSLKKQEEQEEQRLIREQIREEQKAIKEYERAVAKAEQEEKMYRELLEKARKELGEVSSDERLLAEQKIAELEAQLAEAEATEERAKSMAQQTRKGHVYVISNVGSFGEDVYKIGLTRRLEPLDRVKELGDASVPFIFDVHALIYTEDAPALEASLHREFSKTRVNAVNFRKEFFRIDLMSIKNAVNKIAGIDAEFKMTAIAEEYYESRRLQATT